MKVTVGRVPGPRRFDVAGTEVPVPGLRLAQPEPEPVAVSVFGRRGGLSGLAATLPAGWVLRRPGHLDDIGPDDIVLYNGATAEQIGTARAELPRRTRLVAVVDDTAPARVVAAVLTAGADVCVRGGPPTILAGHLLGCRRRMEAER